jgi:hypothetical protein
MISFNFWKSENSNAKHNHNQNILERKRKEVLRVKFKAFQKSYINIEKIFCDPFS